jgi:hypothetical protein
MIKLSHILWFAVTTSYYRSRALSSYSNIELTAYKSAIIPNSSEVCVVDSPTASEPMKAGSKLQCAVQCTFYSWCIVHQMNNLLQQCQMYGYIPTNYTTANDCKAFISKLFVDD